MPDHREDEGIEDPVIVYHPLSDFFQACNVDSKAAFIDKLWQAGNTELYKDIFLDHIEWNDEAGIVRICVKYAKGSELEQGLDYELMLPESEQPHDPRDHVVMHIQGDEMRINESEMGFFNNLLGKAFLTNYRWQ